MYLINLNELTLKNIGQWTNRGKFSILVSVGVFTIAFGYWLIIQENWLLYNQEKVHEFALKEAFENKQRKGVRLSEYRRQVNGIKEHFAELIKQVPEQNELTFLLEEISKPGLASGLKFELFAPQTEIGHDFYVEIPIKISVVGRYVQLANFLSNLAEMHRIVTMQEWSIENLSSKEHHIASEDELLMRSTVTIYQYSAS